jgi:hypothetical protein
MPNLEIINLSKRFKILGKCNIGDEGVVNITKLNTAHLK